MKTTEIGKRLKGVREQRGMTQAELASKAGVHRVTIANYERGSWRMTGDTAILLASALQTDPMYLLGLKNLSENVVFA